MPEECRQVRRLLHSEAMLVLLSQMTGILLHPAAAAKPESDGEDDQAKDKGTEVSSQETNVPSVCYSATAPPPHILCGRQPSAFLDN